MQGWLPEPGGIFYSAQMGFFYNTFYRNPQAEWRYILGLEPALMPEDDLKIYRDIQLSGGAVKAVGPDGFQHPVPRAETVRALDRTQN